MPWLIAYDIADARRLLRVHRRMCGHAVPMQYSVFWLDGSQAALERCTADVAPLIDEAADDLRVYPMPGDGWRRRLGVPALPPGIVWTGLPTR